MKNNKIQKVAFLLVNFLVIISFILPSPKKADAQITQFRNPTFIRESDVGSIGSDIAGDVAGCISEAIFGSIINVAAGAIQNVFGNALSGISSGIQGALGDVGENLEVDISVGGGGEVPVGDSKTRETTKLISSDTSAQRAKEVGKDGQASLDSIVYCLANKTIEGIVGATNNWIRKGFGGNSVFINNPARYFANIAEYELEKIFRDLEKFGLCVNVNINTIRGSLLNNYYRQNYIRIPRCFLGEIDVDIDAFSKGEFTKGGGWDAWHAYTSDPYSNYYGTKLSVEDELSKSTASSQQLSKFEVEINNGYQSIRDDEGNITTPGSIIKSQVEARVNIPSERLTFADEFDEIMNGLINNFIKISINDSING